MKREAEYKSALMAYIRERFPAFIVFEHATAGAPDRAIIGNGYTSYWEFKHATPDFDTPGLQTLCCVRLAVVGFCRYIIWQEVEDMSRTLIVHPRTIMAMTSYYVTPELVTNGINHAWICDYIERVHRGEVQSPVA